MFILLISITGCFKDNSDVVVQTTEFVTETAVTETVTEPKNFVPTGNTENDSAKIGESLSVTNYINSPYVEINNNKPFFTDEDLVTTSFEFYSDLDSFNRCNTAYACIGTDIMPTEKRGEIGHIKPSGWHTVKYDKEIISDLYLYNRCHLIAFMLAGENDNEKNLITGTRYMNVTGMLPFEDAVHDYMVANPENHVMYRVTPEFTGDNLVADGVLMEAYSVEDNGAGVSFCVFCYNVQPGIKIDYLTGDSELDNSNNVSTEEVIDSNNTQTYIINTNSKKFHLPTCDSVQSMSEQNKEEINSTKEELINDGYSPCKNCIGE
jgi:DNA-entry nuclease